MTASSAETFEGLRAYRLLRNIGWIKGIEKATVRRLGSGVINFHAPEVKPRRLKIIGKGQLVMVNGTQRRLAGVSSAKLVESTQQKMPQSWGHGASPQPNRKLRVVRSMEETGPKDILVAGLRPRRVLNAETIALQEAFEKEAGRPLPWKPYPDYRLKLGVVAPGAEIDEADLEFIAGHMPGRVHTKAGTLEPVTIEPIGFSGNGVDLRDVPGDAAA